MNRHPGLDPRVYLRLPLPTSPNCAKISQSGEVNMANYEDRYVGFLDELGDE